MDQVFDILEPLSGSLGEHSFAVTFHSRSSGVIEFMLNWKCFQGELPFNSKDELIEKARELLEMTQEFKS
ncbi:hypothetical protein QUA41_17445 [Microcoleus sp. Pol11C1]